MRPGRPPRGKKGWGKPQGGRLHAYEALTAAGPEGTYACHAAGGRNPRGWRASRVFTCGVGAPAHERVRCTATTATTLATLVEVVEGAMGYQMPGP